MKSLGFYRLTPDAWGETYLMLDETAVIEAVADSFSDIPEELKESLENDTPEKVELMQDEESFFIQDLSEEYFRECQNPENCTDGLLELYGEWKER